MVSVRIGLPVASIFCYLFVGYVPQPQPLFRRFQEGLGVFDEEHRRAFILHPFPLICPAQDIQKLLLCRHQFRAEYLRQRLSLLYVAAHIIDVELLDPPLDLGVGGRQFLLIELDAADRTDHPVHGLNRGLYGPDADHLLLVRGHLDGGGLLRLLGRSRRFLCFRRNRDRSMLMPRRRFVLRCPFEKADPRRRAFQFSAVKICEGAGNDKQSDDNDRDVSFLHFSSAP